MIQLEDDPTEELGKEVDSLLLHEPSEDVRILYSFLYSSLGHLCCCAEVRQKEGKLAMIMETLPYTSASSQFLFAFFFLPSQEKQRSEISQVLTRRPRLIRIPSLATLEKQSGESLSAFFVSVDGSKVEKDEQTGRSVNF